MGIPDRKYSRRDEEEPPSPADLLGNRWVWIALAIIVLAVVIASALPPQDPRSPTEGARLVNINIATAKELESLPGIGPSLAERVITGRPYQTVDDLERVHGIGPNQVAQLKPMLTVTGSAQDTRRPSIWQRLSTAVTGLGAFLLAASGLGVAAGLYFLVRWWRGRSRAFGNARVRAAFEEAERRRWEGHRREKK